MNTLLVAANIVLAVSCLQASPAPETFTPAVPVFRQPYGDGDSSRIVGGQEAAVGQFPYQAAVYVGSSAFCGGSLIGKNWVLTAAHCVQDQSKWRVILGAHNLRDAAETGRVIVETTEATEHEDFNMSNLSSDLAVIKLPKEVPLSDRVQPIKLPPKSLTEKDLAGSVVRVSGWGKTSDSAIGISPSLQFVDLKVMPQKDCQKIYGDIIDEKKYCALGEGEKSTCNGDSGGSLTLVSGKDVTHIGIVSFGSSKGCSKGYPTGYTATPHFLEWIKKNTGIVP